MNNGTNWSSYYAKMYGRMSVMKLNADATSKRCYGLHVAAHPGDCCLLSTDWNTIYKRYSRWCEAGVWGRLLAQVSQEPDLEHLLLDSTILRAHPSAAGAEKKNGHQALGRSRGGFSTKLHVAVDALGNSLRLRLTAGQLSVPGVKVHKIAR
jgi:transposase